MKAATLPGVPAVFRGLCAVVIWKTENFISGPYRDSLLWESAEQVEQVFVAGGFGYRLDYEKAMEIGMFPKEFSGKIQAVGNSSLRGAVRLLCDPERMKEALDTAALAEEIDLSSDAVFQEAYMDAMFFGESH